MVEMCSQEPFIMRALTLASRKDNGAAEAIEKATAQVVAETERAKRPAREVRRLASQGKT